ncbi:tail tape measure domain protein [Pseudomonas phage JG054]|uniref:Tail tape measure domain protein n=1 Tax=Pseudomonas phage JG054 TaxID=1970800 RepID=A0A2H4GY41_9CAUD|nr:tail tape measure domain protein [Pseudomonas phage JG054]ARB11162.1 tail tape measure domain protein [Pseudomonas phage JG054]
MATETIDIRIREDGSRVVKRNLEDVGNTAEKAASGVDILKRALGALAAFIAVDQIRKYADAWASASGQIRIATKDFAEAAAVQEQLFKTAQNTRQGFTDIVELYSRTARSGKELGASQAQLIKFTENVGKTLAASSTSAQQAQGALMQMGQALGSGVVRAEEFNSILEGAPAILQVVANHIDGAEGSIGKLRKMMLDGQLTSKAFFDAMLAGSEEIDEKFGKASFTISQGFTLMSNAFMRWIGQTDSALGISNALGRAMKWIADNMDMIAAAALSVGAAIAVAFVPTAITAVTNAVRALWAVLAANPLGAVVIALTAVVTYLTLMRDEINVGLDDVTTLGDVFRAVGEDIAVVFSDLKELAASAFTGLGDIVADVYQSITQATDQETKNWLAQYTSFYDGVGSGFAGVAKGIARTIDAIAGLLTGLGIAVVRAFAGVPDAIKEMFNRTYNAVVGVVENLVNTVINGVNKMRDAVGMSLIETVQFERKQVDTKFFETYGQNIAQSIDDGFQQQGGFMEKWVDGVFTRAQEIGKDRAAKLGQQTGVDLNQAMGTFQAPGADEKELEKQRKELEKFKNELRSLLNTIAPVEGAKLEMAKAEETLNKAVAKGLITTQDQARYLELLKFHYQDIIDPLGKVNREMDEQIRLLGMSSRARQVESEYMKLEKDLRAQGITLTQEETAALRSKIEMLQRQNELVAAQDQMLANSVEQRRAFNTQIEAMNNLLANPSSGFTAGDAQGQAMGMLGGMGIDTAGMQGQMQAQLELIQTYYAQLDMLRQNDLISEQDYANAKVQLTIRENELKTQNMRNFFSGLASLQSSNIKELAAIGKAAAITQAIMNTYEGATKALAQGGIYGAAMAAVVVASGMAQVAAIRAQQTQGFMTGGNFTVGGTGGADSQMVAFRATPGEQVTVSTPTQVRKGTAAQGQGDQAVAQPTVVTPKIINVLDPSVVGDYLGTDDGEQLIMNVVQRNQRALGY